jgi:hypothetical protein
MFRQLLGRDKAVVRSERWTERREPIRMECGYYQGYALGRHNGGRCGEFVNSLARAAFAAVLYVTWTGSAGAATFGELASWCAPEDAGGRPGLCTSYLQTYLEALRTDNASLNDGVRACVPEATDNAELVRLIRAFANAHPEASSRSGVAGAGEALKDRFPCK